MKCLETLNVSLQATGLELGPRRVPDSSRERLEALWEHRLEGWDRRQAV